MFVVAIASAGGELHHGLIEGHYVAIGGFCMTFMAIWWAWMNYTWYASAYDNDDVVFRTLSFVVMTGALLLAAGVPDLFDDGQSVMVAVGYAVMRVAMVALWLRAAAGHPERRRTALTYAAGIAGVQVLWIGRLAITDPAWLVPTFVIGILLELAVPPIAEWSGSTPFHRHHIAERYSLFTIIVLGEVILATVQALQGHAEVSADLVMLVGGGLLAVFSLWWVYFEREMHEILQEELTIWAFGYGHLFVFASIAALGAALAAAVDVVQHDAHVGSGPIGVAIAVCVLVYTFVLYGIHAYGSGGGLRAMVPPVLLGVVVLGVAFAGLPMGLTVLIMGLAPALLVATNLARAHRRSS